MKKIIVSENEKSRIINLHKKLIVERSTPEVKGEVSLNFFNENSINTLDSVATPSAGRSTSTSGCKKRPCTVVTDTVIVEKFNDDTIVKNYPGDINWKYIKHEDDWYAKKIDGGKVYNISECECDSSVEKLNIKFR